MGAILKLKSLLGGSLNLKIDETATDDEFNITTGGIESGSNANGSYIKYPDGTLICTRRIVSLTADANNSITFPIPFVGDTPIVTFGTTYSSSTSILNPKAHTLTVNGFLCGLLALVSGGSSNDWQTVGFEYTAIGRWK